MAPRLILQARLELICPNVYFQPPSNVQMDYPAIVYQRDTANTTYADNVKYRNHIRYDLTLITRDPDESIWDQLVALPMCAHQRFYVADNLNHDVFTIYH